MPMLALSAQPPSKFAATQVSEVMAHRPIYSRCLKTWMFRLEARPAFSHCFVCEVTFPGLTDGTIQINKVSGLAPHAHGRIDAAVDRRGGNPRAGRLPRTAAMEARRVFAGLARRIRGGRSAMLTC